MIAGGLLYVVGMFVVTMVFNVPLNNALAAVDPASPEGTGAMDALSQRLDLVESRADDHVDAWPLRCSSGRSPVRDEHLGLISRKTSRILAWIFAMPDIQRS